MNKIPRTLLLSATAPGDGSVGELFLRDLLSHVDLSQLAFVILGGKKQKTDDAYSQIPTRYLSEPKYDVAASRWMPRLIQVLHRHLRYRSGERELKQNVDDICRFARNHGVQQIWTVLNSPATYYLASQVSGKLKLPLVTTVWDPPDGVGLHFGLDRLSRRRARMRFEESVRRSVKCGVISERMQTDYARDYGVPTIVLRHGISPDQQICDAKLNADEFHIGFSGSLYAEREWKALMAALESTQWTIQGKPVRLIVAGGRVPVMKARCPARVDYLGWRSMEEVLERMSQCHACYFPYWFNPAFEESVRYCFATKMTTYLTAGVPVFYHGPSDAAVMEFFERYPVAATCHSLERAEIIQALNRLATPDDRTAMMAAIEKAVTDELNMDVFHSRFRKLITENTDVS